MTSRAREEPFAAFIGAYRERLIGIAALVHLDPDRAPALVDAVLARLYASWPRLDDPYGSALRAVLRPAAIGRSQSAAGGATFALVDVEQVEARPDEDIRSELACLSVDERQILVLASYAQLPLVDIAAVLDRDLADVVAQLQAARRRLEQMPRRHGQRRLESELANAARVPSDQPPADSPRAGRSVLLRHRIRLVAVMVVLIVLAAFGIRQALPPPSPVAAGTPAATPIPTPSCNTTDERCRVRLLSAWRTEMAEVISSYLDPQGRYFTGFSYTYNDSYQGNGFWRGGGGALALDLHRMSGGATQVYLQIATSRQYAVRCGQLTGRPCQSQRFMDGDRFTLTDPFDVAHGLEVQHRPEGTYVITVVARNTSRASLELPVTRADLIDLASDPRLRLPPR